MSSISCSHSTNKCENVSGKLKRWRQHILSTIPHWLVAYCIFLFSISLATISIGFRLNFFCCCCCFSFAFLWAFAVVVQYSVLSVFHIKNIVLYLVGSSFIRFVDFACALWLSQHILTHTQIPPWGLLFVIDLQETPPCSVPCQVSLVVFFLHVRFIHRLFFLAPLSFHSVAACKGIFIFLSHLIAQWMVFGERWIFSFQMGSEVKYYTVV